MFARRFYAARFFARRYWPQARGESPAAPTPTPTEQVVGYYEAPFKRGRRPQLALLHALDWQDEYGRLVAHSVMRARMHAVADPARGGGLTARGRNRGRMAAGIDEHGIGEVSGKRGLPDRRMLALFLNEIA